MLATILEPTNGTARLVATTSWKIRKESAQLRFLSTATALYPRLTAQELVEYFGRLNGLDSVTLKKRIDEIFARLDMNEFRDRQCDKLSTGMKQKTSIARTLVHDPPVMIFDEPTSGLDVMTARSIVEFIRECPGPREDSDFLDSRDERGGKTLRYRGNHRRWKTVGGRNAG